MSKTLYSKDQEVLVRQLRKARERIGLSQAVVAKKLGKTQSYISKIESGQLRLDVIQLRQMGKLYGVEMEYFLREE